MRALLLTVLSAALLCVMAAEMETADAQFPRSARSGSGELLSDARCPGGLLSLESPRGDLVCLRTESAKRLVLRGFEPASRDALLEIYRKPVPRIGAPAGGVAAESNGLAVDTYRSLARDGGNVFVAPSAVYLAVSALHEGAGGETKEQIRRVFGLEMDEGDRRAEAAGLLSRLEAHNPYFGMNIRSAMLVDDGFEVDEGYAELARAYGTHVETADAGSGDLARMMDRWAGHATRGAITGISGGAAGSASVLASPAYFEGEWEGWFPRDVALPDWFIGGKDGDASEPDFMRKLCACFYLKSDDIRVAWLKYRDSGLSMFAVFHGSDGYGPFAGKLDEIESSLTAERVIEWASKTSFAADLTLTVPQFRMLSGSDLRDPLIELGLADAFDEGAADLGGVGSGVHLDGVVQKAAIETGWEGSVQPWWTSTNFNMNSFIALPQFFFVILDDATGTILFMGRVADQTTEFEPVFLR